MNNNKNITIKNKRQVLREKDCTWPWNQKQSFKSFE